MVTMPGIKIENINYKIGDFSITNLSLEIKTGTYFVISGSNGAGKSILLKLVAGLNYPESGKIYIFGNDVTNIPPWKRNIGYIPQDSALFPNRTVKENIQFGLEIRRIEKKEMNRQVDQIATLVGVSPLLYRNVTGLSGGEQQKINICRALILKPSILLLDEPVSAIDEEFRIVLCRNLKNIQKKMKITTIHISHNTSEIESVADKKCIMKNGKLNNYTGLLT